MLIKNSSSVYNCHLHFRHFGSNLRFEWSAKSLLHFMAQQQYRASKNQMNIYKFRFSYQNVRWFDGKVKENVCISVNVKCMPYNKLLSLNCFTNMRVATFVNMYAFVIRCLSEYENFSYTFFPHLIWVATCLRCQLCSILNRSHRGGFNSFLSHILSGMWLVCVPAVVVPKIQKKWKKIILFEFENLAHPVCQNVDILRDRSCCEQIDE